VDAATTSDRVITINPRQLRLLWCFSSDSAIKCIRTIVFLTKLRKDSNPRLLKVWLWDSLRIIGIKDWFHCIPQFIVNLNKWWPGHRSVICASTSLVSMIFILFERAILRFMIVRSVIDQLRSQATACFYIYIRFLFVTDLCKLSGTHHFLLFNESFSFYLWSKYHSLVGINNN